MTVFKQYNLTSLRGYTAFIMLNSTGHKILTDHQTKMLENIDISDISCFQTVR